MKCIKTKENGNSTSKLCNKFDDNLDINSDDDDNYTNGTETSKNKFSKLLSFQKTFMVNKKYTLKLVHMALTS